MIHRHVDTTDAEFRDSVIADAKADYDASEGPLLVARLGHVNSHLLIVRLPEGVESP